VTRFRCDVIFHNSFIANFHEIVKVKKNENRSVFDEVMPKILLVPFFRMKIGQYLMKLCLKYYWFLFSGHGVLIIFIGFPISL